MKRFILIILAITTITLWGCPRQIKPPRPEPKEPTDTEWCDDACDWLKHLGCPEGEDFEDGTTCAEFCVDTQQAGHALNPKCIVTEVDQCSEIQTKCREN